MNEIIKTDKLNDTERLGIIMLTLCEAKKNAKALRHRTASYLIDCAFHCVNKDNDCAELYDVINDFAYMCLHGAKYVKNEFYYHDLFKKYANVVIEGCNIVDKKGNAKNQPDAWIQLNGDILPVEIKFNTFDNKALQQLKRYINVFGSKGGVAVGDNLSVKLPDNIRFISNKELIKASGKKIESDDEIYALDNMYLDIYKNAVKQAQMEIQKEQENCT